LFARFSERISNEEFKTLEAQIASRNAQLIWYDRDREFEYWQIRLRGKSYAIAYEVAAEVIYEFLEARGDDGATEGQELVSGAGLC
jgi:hypothetical protein